MRRGFWFLKGLKVLVIVAIALAAFGYIVMSLWNWLVPALFSGPVVSYWQALGLLVLVRLLVGGFRPHHHHGHRRWGGGPFGRQSAEMRERWKQMTPEERASFRERFRRGACGERQERWPGPPPASPEV